MFALLLPLLLQQTPAVVIEADEPSPVFIDGKRQQVRWHCAEGSLCKADLPPLGVRRVKIYPPEYYESTVSDERGRKDFESGVAPFLALTPGARFSVDLEGRLHADAHPWCIAVSPSAEIEKFDCGIEAKGPLKPGKTYPGAACGGRPANVSEYALAVDGKWKTGFVVSAPGLYRFQLKKGVVTLTLEPASRCPGKK